MPYTPENNPYIPGDPYSYDLKWLVDQVKQALELYTPLHDEFTELSDNFTELNNYVMNYFSTLDLTQEVSDKLDEMAADGSLEALLRPLVNEIRTEFDAEIAAQNAIIANQNAAILAQNQDISVLSARMDTFSALTVGSTTGDAELMDARIDTFGRTWANAGDAIRGADDILHRSILDLAFITTVDTPDHWTVGGLSNDMTSTTNNSKRARIQAAYMEAIPTGDLVFIDMGATSYQGKLAVYATAGNLSSKVAEITAGTYASGAGLILVPDAYKGQLYDMSISHRGADFDSVDFTAAEVATLPGIIKFTVVTLKSAIEQNTSDIDALKEDDKYLLAEIFNHPATQDEFNIHFAQDAFITAQTGTYQTNSAYPYYYGQNAFTRISRNNRVLFYVDDPDVCFRAYFYNGADSDNYIDRTDIYRSGVPLAADGKYGNIEYTHIRFNVFKSDLAYTDADYEQCIAAFKILKPTHYLPNTYITNSENRFTVSVNLKWNDSEETGDTTDLTGDYEDINALIRLPYSYTMEGEPTPLIMFGHGASSVITNSTWYTGSHNFYDMMDVFRAAGYAVFDVSNTRNRVGGFPDWGCLPLMNAYVKAWEYIKDNYNVRDDLFILSDSMGTAASLNMIKWYPGAVRAAIQTAPRPFCKYRYETLTGDNKTRMAEAFDLTGGLWDDERLKGFNHYENIITLDNVDIVNVKTPPIKVLVGRADTQDLTQVREYYTALANAGNYIDYREVTGGDHGEMSFLTIGNLKEEALAFFERFR